MTLVEDDLLFSLSSDYEDFDAEKTDKKYEKEKVGKNKKTKNSKKLGKKKKKRNAISDSSDSGSGSDSHMPIINEVDEPVEVMEEEDSTPEPKVQETTIEPNRVRAKNTVYNTSHLTGW